MKPGVQLGAAALGIALLAAGAAPPADAAAAAEPQVRYRAISALAGAAPTFEENLGQADPAVDFLRRGGSATLFLSRGDAVISLSSATPRRVAAVRMRLAGAARRPRGEGADRRAARSNYLLGSDPAGWHIGVANYAQVRYPAVYPRIDLIYHGSLRRQVEYDFVVAPGGDPSRIRLEFAGGEAAAGANAAIAAAARPGPEIDAQGELVLHTSVGDLVQPAPEAYQPAADGSRNAVTVRYVLLRPPPAGGRGHGSSGAAQVGFALGRYDRRRPLVIDPVIAVVLDATFLGGSGDDIATRVAVDAAGNAYITGTTSSAVFPGVDGDSIQPVNSGNDVFVTKIDAAGTGIVYSTFLGGAGGASSGGGIAVDVQGNTYVTGATQSATFTGVAAGAIDAHYAGDQDAFVTKLDASGTAVLYSTFLGGSGDDGGQAIAVDGAGNAYVAGTTSSPNFPGVTAGSLQPVNGGGGSDAFVTKIDPAGDAIVYSTFLGGNALDAATDLALDAAGNAYVTGYTQSSNFPRVTAASVQPAAAGSDDAFVAKLDAAGTAIVYATYLGGSNLDLAHSIAVDAAGNAYVAGVTWSSTFPGVTAASIQPAPGGGLADAFVTKLDAAGTAIVYSTFLGGSGDDAATALAVDAAGNAYVAGNTSSATFPGVTQRSIQTINQGIQDVFLAELDPAGTAILYSTLLGGADLDQATGLALDPYGNIYLAGQTSSPTFPGVTAASLQPANAGATDAFLIKLAATASRSYYTVAPCRIVDTRTASPLAAGEIRRFAVTGACGIPVTAAAISANVTAVAPGAAGALILYAGDAPQPPGTNSLSFLAGRPLAGNAVVQLARNGTGTLNIQAVLPAGTTHVLLDVTGYFQ